MTGVSMKKCRKRIRTKLRLDMTDKTFKNNLHIIREHLKKFFLNKMF